MNNPQMSSHSIVARRWREKLHSCLPCAVFNIASLFVLSYLLFVSHDSRWISFPWPAFRFVWTSEISSCSKQATAAARFMLVMLITKQQWWLMPKEIDSHSQIAIIPFPFMFPKVLIAFHCHHIFE